VDDIENVDTFFSVKFLKKINLFYFEFLFDFILFLSCVENFDSSQLTFRIFAICVLIILELIR